MQLLCTAVNGHFANERIRYGSLLLGICGRLESMHTSVNDSKVHVQIVWNLPVIMDVVMADVDLAADVEVRQNLNLGWSCCCGVQSVLCEILWKVEDSCNKYLWGYKRYIRRESS